MRVLVAIVKLLAMVFGTAGCYIQLLVGRLRWRGQPMKLEELRNRMVQRWARMLAWIIQLHVQTRGQAPQAPGYIVCNHLSYLDIPLLFTRVPCNFVAKAELQSWPFMGFLMKSVHTVFIDRTRKRDIPRVNSLIAENIEKSRLIVVFPEGTSSRGSELLAFKPSLLEVAVQSQLPVAYATIQYATTPPDPPAYLAVCWWGDMTFPDHFFRLLMLRRIDATVAFGKETVCRTDRKELASELWDRMNAQFTPTFVEETQEGRAVSETA